MRHGMIPGHRGRSLRLLLATWGVLVAASQGPTGEGRLLDPVAQRLFTEVMSPYCPGLTLATCPSEGATILKDSIRSLIAVGRTPEQVMSELEARFGPGIRARPPRRGLGLVAWLGPILPLALGAVAVAAWIRRSARRTAVAAPEPMTGVSDTDAQRLAAALREDR